MTSQSNVQLSSFETFRLQRLTKTMVAREHSKSEYEPKETFKLAAINSISQGVKHSDVSFMSGRDLNKLRMEPESGNDFQYESAHLNLTGVRKNYDGVHRDKTDRELSINKLKEEKRKLSFAESELKDNIEKGVKSVKEMEEDLNRMKLVLCEAEMQKKVLIGMKNRLKEDKIVYDQRKYNLSQKHKFLQKQQEILAIDKNDVSEVDDRTSRIYKQFVNQLNLEKNDRDTHINGLESMGEERQRITQLNDFRNKEINEIAERAMQDKDDNEKSWERLYLSNKLVSRLLRDKMEREMQKFSIVETSFKIIKISTGVSDAESLVTKFLNKESAYGDLLGKIAENENKILQLKQDASDLTKEFKELESEREDIESSRKPPQNIEAEMKDLSEVCKKEENTRVEEEKLRSWIVRGNKKMNSLLGSSYNTNIPRDLKQILNEFLTYIQNLNTQVDSLNTIQIIEEKVNTEENIKVKGLGQLKERNKSTMRGDDEEDFNDSNRLNYFEEENELIAGQRMELLKSNEKFMKEVRKKFEENKRIALESASPKKKNEAEKAPIKKAEDE